MKILYDHQIFSYQDFGGVSRYFCEMLKHIPREYWDISVIISNNIYLKNMKTGINYYNFFSGFSFPKKARLMLELGKFHSISKIRLNNYDILHLTHYESYGLKHTKKHTVLTYYDKCNSSYGYNKHNIREQVKCFKHIDAIITISENTKRDLMSLFDLPENKISVIYLGINPSSYKYQIPRLINKKYLLYVGMRKGYKNFSLFLEAFSYIVYNYDIELILVCTGNNFDTDEKNLINKLRLNDNIFIKRFTDDELINLYRFAELFVFPSKYEGFGLPLLEAMDNLCPVICSNTSCFPEIAGNAALFFDPDDKDSMINAMLEILSSDTKRKKLIELGKMRSQQFTWEKTAQEHLRLYQSLL
jgi:glycosyltransferase involved in cell wall biosynthesis